MFKKSLYFLWFPVLVAGSSIIHSTSKPENLELLTDPQPETSKDVPKRRPSKDDSSKPIYFDITHAMNKYSYYEINKILNQTSHVYYSTDRLVTEILDLSWVINLFKTHHLHLHDNSSLCLMLSYQITKDRRGIDWRHMADVLYTIPTSNGTEDERLKVLKKHLCGLVLDFQLGNLTHPNIDHDSFHYAERWDLSFTKYAKRIMNTIFGKEHYVPIGVAYNEFQLREESNISHVSNILLEKEIKNADFLIVNAEFSPIERMPLEYGLFKEQFHQISRRNELFLGRIDVTGNPIPPIKNVDVTYMITWRRPYLNMSSFSLRMHYYQVLSSAENTYLAIFQYFVATWVKQGNSNIGIISGTSFSLPNASKLVLYDSQGKIQNALPYLYVHEVDTTPCQLRTMLAQISEPFETLIVNEFTWSALARNEDIMNDPEKQTCASRNGPLKTPKNAMLLASEGIGRFWNTTKIQFKNLLSEHTSISDMNLTTVVFSGDDLYAPAPRYGMTGIQEFVDSWVKSNMSAVGCLVNLPPFRYRFYDAYDVAQFIKDTKCQPIFEQSSVFVVKYTINSTFDLVDKFNNEFGQWSMKRDLFYLLAAREMIKSIHPKSELIFDIEVKDNAAPAQNRVKLAMCSKESYQKTRFQTTLFEWARIHGAQLMFKPAFDMRNPKEGIWMPPKEDGSEVLSDGRWAC